MITKEVVVIAITCLSVIILITGIILYIVKRNYKLTLFLFFLTITGLAMATLISCDVLTIENPNTSNTIDADNSSDSYTVTVSETEISEEPADAGTVLEDKGEAPDVDGVVNVNLVYVDENGDFHVISSGSGFMISDYDVVTANSIVWLRDEDIETYAESFDVDQETFQENLSIKINAYGIVPVNAKIVTNSKVMNFAFLRLETKLSGIKAFGLRSTSDVIPSEVCYGIGYNFEVADFDDPMSLTRDDIIVTSGTVNQIKTDNGLQLIMCSNDYVSGNKGGPLVDAHGNVIGIIIDRIEDETGNYIIALGTDMLIETIDRLGIWLF